MNNIYQKLRFFSRLKSPRIKLTGIAFLHLTGQRYLGLFIDPVLSCNFRCKMCYFSDPEIRKTYSGKMDDRQIEKIANALFHRALKLQIGCGAEPTLYKNLAHIIRLGHRYRIPYISMTTNGNLLTEDQMETYVKAGLNELTLSTHGITKKTYEELMVNGNFEIFCELLQMLARIKKKNPGFKIRINYTMNEDNIEELGNLFSFFEGIPFDILQLRPIQQIGDTAYRNFSLERIHSGYDRIIEPIRAECKRRDITLLAPTRKNLIVLEEEPETDNSVYEATYCYVSPHHCWKDDFDPDHDTYESYTRRTGLTRTLTRKIFGKSAGKKKEVTRKLNYTID